MVCELMDKGKPLYLCSLCGCHSNRNAMFYHLIGHKHTDSYIVSYCPCNSYVVFNV